MKKETKKILIYVAISLVMLAAIFAYTKYRQIMGSYVHLEDKEYAYVYIPSDAEFSDLYDALDKEGILSDTAAFLWLAERKNLKRHIHPGKYKIKNAISLNKLINQLRSGKQIEVNLTFNNIRTKQELAGVICKQIQCDSSALSEALFNDSITNLYGFDTFNIVSMFVPNTYKVYWGMNAKQLMDRMHKEYNKFWNNTRSMQAKAAGLNQQEVSILASIVQEETLKTDEKPKVAGLYMNRINRGIALQADPTLKYALRNFAKKRILNKDKKVNSRYNTYKYPGLPPGPICVPSINSIDAVLNFEKHNYIYMCAREDFSGYHNFASKLSEHNLNARKYQRKLNKRGIYK